MLPHKWPRTVALEHRRVRTETINPEQGADRAIALAAMLGEHEAVRLDPCLGRLSAPTQRQSGRQLHAIALNTVTKGLPTGGQLAGVARVGPQGVAHPGFKIGRKQRRSRNHRQGCAAGFLW
jgi:hypothetical protein